MYSLYRQCVSEGGGGELCCVGHILQEFYTLFLTRYLPNCFTTPNKMTSEDDIKGLVSLKFLRPWAIWIYTQLKWAKCKQILFMFEDLGAIYMNAGNFSVSSITAKKLLKSKQRWDGFFTINNFIFIYSICYKKLRPWIFKAWKTLLPLLPQN